MIKKFLERIFLTSIFMLVVSVFVGMAYELQVAQSPTAYAHKVISNNGSSIKQALFSPEDDVKSVLIGLINQEKKHISLAIFTLTDNKEFNIQYLSGRYDYIIFNYEKLRQVILYDSSWIPCRFGKHTY